MARKKGNRKRKLAVIDFETDPFRGEGSINPFAAGLYTGDDYRYFWGDDCAQRLAGVLRAENLRVYAHNGGRFDFFFLMEELEKYLFLINNRIAKCEIGESLLLDSYLILPLPLSAYKKDAIDYDIMREENRNEPENKKEILKYLKTDCVYLYEWVSKFIGRFGAKLTVAQTAFDQLSKTGYPCKRRSSKFYDGRIRKFYLGGRTQSLKNGFFEGHIKVYDINSAYPRAMRDYHPFGTGYYSIQNPKKLPEDDFYFATIRAVSRGGLPVKVKETVSFPDDGEERTYHTTSWEIRAGLDTGTLDIIAIEEVFVWNETRHFREYVDGFYDEKKAGKKEGDKDKTTFAKLMLVSPYGKFGADPLKYKKTALCGWDELPMDEEELEEMDEMEMEVNDYIKLKEWKIEGDTDFGKTFWSRPDPGDSFFNVAVAASVTGWVRAYLWRAMCESEDVFYCDTDSIICREFHGKVGDDIGEWEFEAESFNGIYIGGKKLYTMELNYCELRYDKNDVVIKEWNNGEIKKAHKGARLTHEEIVSIVKEGKTIEWHSEAPTFSLSRGVRYVKREIKMTGD